MSIETMRGNVTGGWCSRTMMEGVDNNKTLIHAKRWDVYVNEK